MPGGFEKNSLLRVHQLSFFMRNVEKQRIELINTADKTSPLTVDFSLLHSVRTVIRSEIPTFLGDFNNTVFPSGNVFPELLKSIGIRISSAHTDNGNILTRLNHARCRCNPLLP